MKFLYLVGGFAQSTILRSSIEKTFKERVRVIVPPRPGIVVMNGAVRYGFDPSAIKERIVQQTIGVGVALPWNDNEHSGRRQVVGENKAVYCDEGVFCLVKAGNKIGINHEVTHSFVPLKSVNRLARIPLLGSLKPSISFESDEGSTCIGMLKLEIPDVGAPRISREIAVALKFGGTTFTVTATYKSTGKSTSAKFDLTLGTTLPSLYYPSSFVLTLP